MKLLNRDFTVRERILLLLLVLVLIGIAYYMFIFKPAKETVDEANIEMDSLNTELNNINADIAILENMQTELDNIKGSENLSSVMPSYNNQKAEVAELNTAFADLTNYSVSFSSVSRDGDQIRRNFSYSFTAYSYDQVESILDCIAHNSNRCLLGDCSFGFSWYENSAVINVSGNATFYETMVGGTADAGLPSE